MSEIPPWLCSTLSPTDTREGYAPARHGRAPARPGRAPARRDATPAGPNGAPAAARAPARSCGAPTRRCQAWGSAVGVGGQAKTVCDSVVILVIGVRHGISESCGQVIARFKM
eukprot:1266233-Rhodomonas_salina.1